MKKRHSFLVFVGMLMSLSAIVSCDEGLQPLPPPPPQGAIRGIIHYTGTWPDDAQIRDLRFVAMRIVPGSIPDVIGEVASGAALSTEGLKRFVTSDTFLIPNVTNGEFPYSGVAQLFGANPFNDWRVLGVYSENGGRFEVRGDTTNIQLTVDFQNLPPFPPIIGKELR